jgi:hypothetical protein
MAEAYTAEKVSVAEVDDVKKDDPSRYWTTEIDAAEKRLTKFHGSGSKIVSRFLDERSEDKPEDTPVGTAQFRLNLFHTHVSTVMSMLYGRVPKTDVTRRFADSRDDVARVAATMQKRMIDSSIEAPGDSFSDVLRACLQDRMLPGMGVARIRYEFESESHEETISVFDPELGTHRITTAPREEVTDERAPVDYIFWKDFLWGYGRTWSDVPWVAFKHRFTKKKVGERFGNDKVNLLQYIKVKSDTGERADDDAESGSPWEEALVYEIWDKETKKVIFWSKDLKEPLESRNDPLMLEGFFPCPEPFIANSTTTLFHPVADFHVAQDLYNEIDVLQTRISILTKAVKVVGLYNMKEAGVQRMLQEGVENDLIPVDNWAMFAENGGVQGAVSWLPLGEIVGALTQLKDQLNTTLELLYQVTGLSDILRGAAPAPRESAASAQQRARFASVRIQYLQDQFAKFASELARLKAEVISRHFEPETIIQQANVQYMTESPETILDAVQLVKSTSREWPWRVEIKPESIAMIDYDEIKRERSEVLTGIASFVQNITPILQQHPNSAPMFFEIMRWALAGFRGSQEIEGVIDEAIEVFMQPASQDNQSQGKIAEIQAKSQAEMRKEAQKHQNKLEELRMQFQATMAELDGATDAAVYREKMQAHYNILEKQASDRVETRKDLRKARAQVVS